MRRLALLALGAFACTPSRPECGLADTGAAKTQKELSGVVYIDKNSDGIRNPGEKGLPGVLVSNGSEVVVTDKDGAYSMPVLEEMVVFITKPAGFDAPSFYYIHRPVGSPEEIQEYTPLAPTGPLPSSVDFALRPAPGRGDSFRMLALGDTQVRTDEHVSFLRDSLLPAVRRLKRTPTFAIAMGDLVDNTLSLYPRYRAVMAQMGFPTHFVPGNHDVNFDSPNDRYSLETYQRFFGPPYYSFDYGQVHFIVLDSVVLDGHDHQDYHGEFDAAQLRWLAADLAQVPRDKLIVLNQHIPFASWIDRKQHDGRADICNRKDLFELLEGREVLALAGHTHTVESFPGGHVEEGWGQPIPFPQLITGAVCGSWWEGAAGPSRVPFGYMRDGAPRGFFIIDFDGTRYGYRYVPTVGAESDMHISVTDGAGRPTLLGTAQGGNRILANIWPSRTDAEVTFEIAGTRMDGSRAMDFADPIAVAHLEGHSSRLMMKDTAHMWTAVLPSLPSGLHRLVVTARNPDGLTFTGVKTIEVRAPEVGAWQD